MAFRNIAQYLIDDVNSYRLQGSNDLLLNIYLSSTESLYFHIIDNFSIKDSDFLYIEEKTDGLTLKTMIRIDSIISYDFAINNNEED